MTLRSASSILSAQDYNPFGEEIRSYLSGGVNDKYKFTGKERDKESGLDYFGARYYDSEVGRWLSVDPLASKYSGWSPYNYCMNNPLELVDPDGMDWYKNKEGVFVYDPNLTYCNQSDYLKYTGGEYVGMFFNTNYASFNIDGSATFGMDHLDEAVQYMKDVQNKLHREEMGIFIPGGIFMLPNYKASNMGLGLSEVGYSLRDGYINGPAIHAKAFTTIHTHSDTNEPSGEDVKTNWDNRHGNEIWYILQANTGEIYANKSTSKSKFDEEKKPINNLNKIKLFLQDWRRK